MTSRRAVDVVGRLTGEAKVGHAGTLDPLAGGVLVLCLGAATRLIEYVQRMPKRYTGTFLLGRRSPTEDIEGEIVELTDPPIPPLAEIKSAAAKLTGIIEQRPPAFSAIKVQGRRAYNLARAGKPLELKPRPVHVYGISVVSYNYPELSLEIECGSGTYIRSLGRDLAELLSTAAVMSQLVRTAVGCFDIAEAVALDALSQESLADHLLPPSAAVQMLPQIRLNAEELAEIRHGRNIEIPAGISAAETEQINAPAKDKQYAAIAPDGRLAAILIHRDESRLRPLRNFLD